jgi:hypothetical protein
MILLNSTPSVGGSAAAPGFAGTPSARETGWRTWLWIAALGMGLRATAAALLRVRRKT